MTEDRAIEAIRNITDETGYPPTPEELAYALGAPLRNVQSALGAAKKRGEVHYDENGCLVATPLVAA